ncbi:hypothetical protein I1A62_30125 [Rhodococcus sp. USK10]|uniref:hypothetical protein n=1 Tax=Rhodococcus sp. USK10 TaxID=2789739 RepID=UPI001C5E6E8E|nr:hypothetical protein [Rhodococcus sp. USK10]QYB01487.1 hypothetical protein I1A62_30125 [Rhodococcus sp. USK10]
MSGVRVGLGSAFADASRIMVGVGGTAVAATRLMVGVGGAAVRAWPPPVELFDDFNRSNGYLTSPWVSYGSSPYLPYIDSNAALVFGNTTDGTRYAHARHSIPMNTDDVYVRGQISTTNNTWPTWVFLGSNTSTDDRMNLRWTNGTLDIVRRLSGVETVVASGSSSQAAGRTFELRRSGNVYTGLVNGGPVSGLSWTDTADTYPRDTSHRSTGWGGTSRRSLGFSSWSPFVDNWWAGDIAA